MTLPRLDRELTLQQLVPGATNEFNEPAEGWENRRVYPAGKSPINDTERFRAGQTGTLITDRFTIRWDDLSSTIDEHNWRVFHEGKAYDIKGLKEIGRHEGLEITAAAVRAP